MEFKINFKLRQEKYVFHEKTEVEPQLLGDKFIVTLEPYSDPELFSYCDPNEPSKIVGTFIKNNNTDKPDDSKKIIILKNLIDNHVCDKHNTNFKKTKVEGQDQDQTVDPIHDIDRC